MGLRKVQIGEITPPMTSQFEKGFWQCVANNKYRREPYYILYTADWYRNGEELRDSFRSSATIPPKMLNTMCWRIDNKTGRCEEMWVLPVDAPIQPIITDGVSEVIGEATRGLPLIYGSQEKN